MSPKQQESKPNKARPTRPVTVVKALGFILLEGFRQPVFQSDLPMPEQLYEEFLGIGASTEVPDVGRD